MNVPVFIDIGLEEQAEELRTYFKGKLSEVFYKLLLYITGIYLIDLKYCTAISDFQVSELRYPRRTRVRGWRMIYTRSLGSVMPALK
jgi:hypothetical protein